MPIALEILSPERRLLARDVDMVVIPGTEGDLGILPGHANLITSLRAGHIDLYANGKITDRFLVTGGYAEINGGYANYEGTRCAVLADAIERADTASPPPPLAADKP
jgi:F-type H+-transporting ATPase subunit epsilon